MPRRLLLVPLTMHHLAAPLSSLPFRSLHHPSRRSRLNSPLYLPPSASPSARYPSNSWTSFVPSAVARLYPVPTASSILTLADLQCRDRLRDAARLLPLLPDEAIARMLGSSLTECFRADPAHVAYLVLQILICFGPSTLSPVATTLRDLHDAAAAGSAPRACTTR